MRNLAVHTEDAIGQHGKVRTVADAVDGICGVWLTMIEVSCNRGREVASCGESPDTDAIRIDAQFRRVRPNVTHGSLAIEDWRRVVVSRSHTIVEHKSCDRTIIQPPGDLSTF